MHYLRLFVLFAAIVGLASATTITEDFNSGLLNGWTITSGGLGPVVDGAGGIGNTPYLRTEDAADGYLFFAAPTSWSGNFYGGKLTFFLRNVNAHNYGDPVVRITGSGGPDLYYYNAPGPNADWTFNAIDLLPGSHWSTNPYVMGHPFTPTNPADVEATLSSITRIYILGDWAIGYYGKTPTNPHDITGLDDVNLSSVPEPASFALIGLGLLALAAIARQKK